MNISVSRRYARALFEVATEDGAEGVVDEVLARVQGLALTLEQSPELRLLIEDPQYSRTTIGSVMDRILEQQGASISAVRNMVKLLIQRRRLSALGEISRIYGLLADARAGRVRGRVTTAAELPPETLERLEASLERLTQREVVLDSKVDPSLLGGVSTQLGSTVYDGSLRNQLETLRRSLKVA